MKLRNKKTGEIVKVESLYLTQLHEIYLSYTNEKNEQKTYFTDKITTFASEWDDYEKPKEWYWFIEDNGIIQRSCHHEDLHPTLDKARKEIGNYFETKEEAEKAVEKLKAWKRLKDKGFEFDYVDEYENLCGNGFEIPIRGIMPAESYRDKSVLEDSQFLFGGEE